MTEDSSRAALFLTANECNPFPLMFETDSAGSTTVSPRCPNWNFMNSARSRGFSLLEMITVIAIGFILAGISFITLMPTLKQNHVDQAYDTALSTIRNYRNQSVTQSKRYILTFTTPGTI